MKLPKKIAECYICYHCLHSLFKCFLLIFIVSLCLKNFVNGQASNTGKLYIYGSVYINTNFTNAATASYQNDGSLFITGNFTNQQSGIKEGTGNTLFIGTVLQNISGSQAPVFHHAT